MAKRKALRQIYEDLVAEGRESAGASGAGAVRKRRAMLHSALRDEVDDLAFFMQCLPEGHRSRVMPLKGLAGLLQGLYFQVLHEEEVISKTRQFKNLRGFARAAYVTLWGLRACRMYLNDKYQEQLYAEKAEAAYRLLYSLFLDAAAQLRQEGEDAYVGNLAKEWSVEAI